MEDGLYLANIWVAEVGVLINRQANDLSQPTQLQADFTNVFQLPDTSQIRWFTQNAEQIDAGGRAPYQFIPAKIIESGEVLFSGNASLLSFQGGWKVSLSAPFKGLFDQLAEVKLSQLNLSRYDHRWTIDVIDSFADATDGIIYPCIDYGSITGGIFAQDTLLPAIYVKTLATVMLHRFGYRAVGDWLTDDLYNRIALPFVEAEPQAHNSDWQQARFARVTVTGTTPIPPLSTVDGILQFNRANEPLWYQGSQGNFKASARYVCDSNMRLRVQAYQQFAMKVDFGAVECMLIVEKNGQNAIQHRQSFGGPFGQFSFGNGTPNVFLKLDEYVECRQGDQIQIRLVIRKQTTFAQFIHIGFIREEDTHASFEPSLAIKTGDNWPVSANLPDLNCADILKSIALLMSGTYDVNDTAKTIELKTLSGVVSNTASTQDLSHCVEESTEPINEVVLAPYGQKNHLKWKPTEDKVLKGYGDGVIIIGAQNMPVETTLFELPFAAVPTSKNAIAGYGEPPQILTRVVSGNQVQKQKAEPCLILVEPTKPVTVVVNAVNVDLTITPTRVRLMSCWWSGRPNGASTATNGFSLAFDRPPLTTGREQTLSQRYFGGLRRVLRRPRKLTVSAYLRPVDFVTVDFYAPVRLRAVRAGALDLNDGFYYLNKISAYSPGKTCTVELIPY